MNKRRPIGLLTALSTILRPGAVAADDLFPDAIRHIVVCSLGLLVAFAPTSLAQPVTFGANAYEFVEVSDPFSGTNNSWTTARDAAAASVFQGANGHLATVTSQAENDFLLSIVPGGLSGLHGAWLGGKQPEGWLVGPEAGQTFTYSNWGGAEPNNSGFAYMNVGTAANGVAPGQWADDSIVQGVPDATFDPVTGYFIEYEAPAQVPMASGWGMALLGIALLTAVTLLMIRRVRAPTV